MAIINGKDVHDGLLNPTHDSPFPRTQRMMDKYFSYVPELDIERAVLWTESYKQTEGQTAMLRRAKAYKHYAENRSILIKDDELFLGKCADAPRAGTVSPEYVSTWLREEIDGIATRERDTYQISEEKKRILKEEVFPYWENKTIYDGWVAQIPEETKTLMLKTGIIDAEVKIVSAPGELAPNMEMVINRGFKDIKEEAQKHLEDLDRSRPDDCAKMDFYEGSIMTIDALSTYIRRCAAEARKLAETADEERKAELLEMAENAEWVSEYEPKTFHQALQLMWFILIGIQMEGNAPGVSPGRVDQFLYKYYKADYEAGRIDDDRALELIENLYMLMGENTWLTSENTSMYFTGYQCFLNMCVGGVDRHGKDATNSLSFMFLTAKMHCRLHSPNVSARVHKGTPQDLMLHYARLIKYGMGYPALHTDDVGIRAMLSLGATMEEAYNYQLVGCVEPFVPGVMTKWSDGGHYNFGSAIEFVLTNGVSVMNDNRQVSIQTGDPCKMTFDEIKEAVKRQLDYFVYHMSVGATICERLHSQLAPQPFLSALITGCYDSGKDITHGGAKYHCGPAFIGTGLVDLCNSLSAIKKFVFDEKTVTMEDMVRACKNNFEGQEELLKLVQTKTPCYGNDIPEVDTWAEEFSDYAKDQILSYTSFNGTPFCNGLYPVTAHVPHGLVVSALPYGRLAGTPLSDGISPKGGTDHEGPTAVLKSVSHVNHENHTSGTLLNMRLDPVSVEGEVGLKRITQIIRAAADLNLWHIQFNVVTTETLLAAQKNPENYKGLIVRVAGYSAYFGELNKAVQDDVISRTIHTA